MIGTLRVSALLGLLVTFYGYLIIAYVLLSWIPVGEGFLLDAYRVLASLCEPYVGLFRRIVPQARIGGGGLDFSPLIAYLVLQIGGRFIVQVIAGAGF